MASGTKHFMFNRADDWLEGGTLDGLTTQGEQLALTGSKGYFFSFGLDSLSPGTTWHRLCLDAVLPDNAMSRLYVYCAQDDAVQCPGVGARPLDQWLADSSVPAHEKENWFMQNAQIQRDSPSELPLFSLRGRFVWVCLVLMSFSGEPACVSRMRVEFPRIAFIDYLPQLYRDAASRNSFLARFIGVFQSLYVDLEEKFDDSPSRYDALAADPDFLHWLTDWLDLSDSQLWPEEKLRLLVRDAARLYAMKGTKAALCELIALYTGVEPIFVEQFEVAQREIWQRDRDPLARLYGQDGYTFTVMLPASCADARDPAKLLAVIDRFKPVDAVCNLVYLEDTVALDQHCYLGVNSRITGSGEMILGDALPISTPPYLVQ